MPLQRTFPNPNHMPAELSQFPVHEQITRLVSKKFATPERAIVFWFGGVPWAAMPETAIHEHRQLDRRKNEIWFAKHRLISPPAGDFIPTK